MYRGDYVFLGFITAMIIVLLLIIGGLMYAEGSAKAEYLRQSGKGEYTWYQAAFLPNSVFTDVKVDIE